MLLVRVAITCLVKSCKRGQQLSSRRVIRLGSNRDLPNPDEQKQFDLGELIYN